MRMSTNTTLPHKRRTVPLSLRIAAGFVLAAILPLLVTLIFTFTQTTPALIDQANKAMTNDASTRAQLIENYLQERVLDVVTVQQESSQISNVQRMFTVDLPGSPAFEADATAGGYYVVEAGMIRSKDYIVWSMFTTKGQMLLSYPTANAAQAHGNSLVPPEELQMVDAGKTFISPAYYSPQSGKSTVDIYAPVTLAEAPGTQTAAQHPIIGFLRATLDLEYVFNIVKGDTGNNGDGSYAYIVDENGVRIIDTDAQQRFTSVVPLSLSTQRLISSEKRFGSTAPVQVVAQQAVARNLQEHTQLAAFQAQLAGNNQQFRIVQQAMDATVVPWDYIVLSPVSSETAVARQQQLNIIIVAILASLVVAGLGLLIGQSISLPILSIVRRLLNNSESLRDLAIHQQHAASSQTWVVDSSQVGLRAVRYYTDATKVASNRLLETTQTLGQSGQYLMNNPNGIRKMEQIVPIARYIKAASTYQNSSNQKLEVSLKVAAEVTEQLNEGASSARESSEMLEKIVEELRTVIGR
jgi:hypothetical protein